MHEWLRKTGVMGKDTRPGQYVLFQMHSEIHGHYPLPRRNTNEKLLPLELESDLRFMRAFKKRLHLFGEQRREGTESRLTCHSRSALAIES